jgi:hypothetical protein
MEGALDVCERLPGLRVSKHIVIELFPATALAGCHELQDSNVHRDFPVLSPLGLSSHNNIPREIYLIASQILFPYGVSQHPDVASAALGRSTAARYSGYRLLGKGRRHI